jgi:hypothetical protein
MRRVIAAGVLVAALAGGCSSGSHHVTSPSTTAAANPEVVPAVITPAYVDSVFVVLNHAYSTAARELRTAHSLTPQVKANLRAVFNDPVYGTQIQAAEQAVQEGAINNVRSHGGDATTVVTSLIAASPTCVFVQARTDVSALYVRVGSDPASEYYELQPKVLGNDPSGINSTPWAISVDRAFTTPTRLPSSCPA